jgi:glyoxylase-like metal-dependent hydrolase (beta-lactamase superfamily II)
MLNPSSIQVDHWIVWPLNDGYLDLDLNMFVGTTPADLCRTLLEMGTKCVDGHKVRTQVQAYLIDTKEQLILIDTGRGSKGVSTVGLLEKSLLNTGHHPHQISHVLLTHFHPDHIGGLLNSAGAPAFPNATISIPAIEANYWLDPIEETLSTAMNRPCFAFARSMLEPYLSIGKVRCIEPGEEILSGITAVEAFGHTPGHTAFLAKDKILFWGDIIHIAALQFAHPDWYIVDDINGSQAAITRKRILTQVVDQNLIVAGAHLTHSGLGSVSRKSDVFAWTPFKIEGNFSIRICATPQENEDALAFRQRSFFDVRGIKDPYVWTFDHKDHSHFVLYKEAQIIGYAHIQYWPNHRTALRIIVIDEKEQRKGYGSYLLKYCEQTLKEEGIQVLQTEATPSAVKFYQHLGYSEMPFDDPDKHPSDERDVPMGKRL